MARLDIPSQPVRPGIASPLARRQYAALAWMQSRAFLNSFRSGRGSFEAGARIVSWLIFAAAGIGPAVGMGIGAWALISDGHLRMLAIPLWTVTVMWQFFSALAPALAGQNPDFSHLLRFPVSFGSWVLLYLLYGLVAPSTVVGCLWTLGIGVGISFAQPEAAAWVALTLAVFVLFNLLLSRMILAWIERWMARRRSREIITAVFLLTTLCVQFLNPAFYQRRHRLPWGLTRGAVASVEHRFWEAEEVLPPGLAADSIVQSIRRRGAPAFENLGSLALFTVAAALLLGIRLRAESRGENLSEAPRASMDESVSKRGRPPLFDFSGPVAAVFEKDLRYLLRSGPMLYNLASPLVMVFLLGGAVRYGNLPGIRMKYALPMGLIWAFLGLARLVSNNLGGEGAGIQFYFLAPTPLRSVILGKNALHLALFCLEALLITVLIVIRFGPPSPEVAAVTLCWILFAVPANLAAGNALSITMPYRTSMTRMSREQGSLGNVLLSMLTQLGIVVLGALVIGPFAAFGHPWGAVPVLLLLAMAAGAAWWRTLAAVDRTMAARREALTLDLAKIAQPG